MGIITRIAAVLLLLWGVPLSWVSVALMLDKEPETRSAGVAGLIIFGLPPTAMGAGLLYWAQRGGQKGQRDRLRDTFFQLIQTGQGDITVLQFAMETGLNGEAAATYLDERAQEFNAAFRATDDGGVVYVFALTPSLAQAEGGQALVLEESAPEERVPENWEDDRAED